MHKIIDQITPQKFKFEFVNGRTVLSAKENNWSKIRNLHIQSSKGVTADA